jgi:hypothetical protein
VIAAKFLGRGGVGLFSGFGWPLPVAGEPGAWVEVEGPLEPGRNGIHACRPQDLTDWIDDELWAVELDGELEEREATVVARRGRLLRRVEAWTPDAARAFAEACLWRTRDRVVDSLRAHGLPRQAAALGGAAGLYSVQADALAAAAGVEGSSRDLLVHVADGVELIHGGRPDRYRGHPAAAAAPTPGAVAANLGFVTAHVAGLVAGGALGAAEAYAGGFAAERLEQLAWLEERLSLARELGAASPQHVADGAIV